MKNKKNIYILLPIVLFIWGTIVYQFFSFTSGQELLEVAPNDSLDFKPLSIKEIDTSSINVNYRDPFLGKMYASNPSKNVTNKRITSQSKVIIPVIWPSILYKGIVSDVKDKRRVFMVLIDGKTFLMKQGDMENGIFLKKGDRDALYLKFQDSLNVFLLNE